MDNYFILLELSFNPIENDEKIILKAIENKRMQWQKEIKNPRKQIKAQENLSKIEIIKDIMLNPSKRKIEAEKAEKIQKSYLNDLNNELTLLQLKGYLTQQEYSELINKYNALSLSKDIITNNISVDILDKEPNNLIMDEIQVIDIDIIKQLEMYFENLDLDDMSVYNFLELPENSPAENVIEKSNIVIKTILEKGEKNNKDEIIQKITGLVLNIFPNHQTEYNNYLSGCRFLKINKLIQTAIKNSNNLTLKTYDTLAEICSKEYDFDINFAYDYILYNCNINKCNISEDVLLQWMNKDKQENKKCILEPKKNEEENYNTNNIINNMLNPINTILINNQNKVNQMTSYLQQYKENREKAGAAIPLGLFYTAFILFFSFSFMDIIIFSIDKKLNKLVLLLILGGIIINIFGIIIMYSPFNQWKKMCKNVSISIVNNEKNKKLYDEFINLNFNLLLDDNKVITEKLKDMKLISEDLLKSTTNCYNSYLQISKKYQQKDYYWKVILMTIVCHIGIILLKVLIY